MRKFISAEVPPGIYVAVVKIRHLGTTGIYTTSEWASARGSYKSAENFVNLQVERAYLDGLEVFYAGIILLDVGSGAFTPSVCEISRIC